jgi:hypothetical protein
LSGALGTVLYGGLAATLFFAIVGLSSFLGLQYNVGYEVNAIDLVIFSKSTDPFVWLVTVVTTSVASLALAILSRRERKVYLYLTFLLVAIAQISLFLLNERWSAFFISLVFGAMFLATWILLYRRRDMQFQSWGVPLSRACFLGILVIVESLALAFRTLTPFYGSRVSFLARPEQLQTQMSGSLFTYSPILMLVAMYIWAPMLFLIYRRHFVIGKTVPPSDLSRANQPGRKLSVAMLGAAIAVAVLIPLFPYARQSGFLGVDVLDYYSRLSSISSLGDALRLIASGAPPSSYEAPYLILLYVIKVGTGWNAYQVLIVGPIFLATFYTVTVYMLTTELTRSALASGVAALFASSSFHTTVGMFSAIYANWLAMSLALLCTCFVIKAIKGESKSRALTGSFAIILAYATALCHIWTWAILMLVYVLTFVLLVPIHEGDGTTKWHVKTYAIIILLSVLPMLVIVPAMPGLSQGFGSAASEYSVLGIVASVSTARLSYFLSSVTFTLREYAGAILAYGWVFVLAILGGILLAKNKPKAATLLAAWLMVTSFGMILLDPSYQWRVLYVIPFEVYAAVGVLGLLEGLDWACALGTNSPRLIMSVKILLMALIVLDSVNRALMNTTILPFS